MKRLAFLSSVVALTAGLTIFSGAMPAKADAAFCTINYGTSGRDCNYYTLAQCQAASRGIGGSCVANSLATFARYRGRAAH
jgi:hypothetical protein